MSNQEIKRCQIVNKRKRKPLTREWYYCHLFFFEKQFWISSSFSQGNHTYTTTVLSSFGLSMNDEEYLPSLYSIQKVCASVYANYIILLELPLVLPSLFLNCVYIMSNQEIKRCQIVNKRKRKPLTREWYSCHLFFFEKQFWISSSFKSMF
jgi:hypothetical protein